MPADLGMTHDKRYEQAATAKGDLRLTAREGHLIWVDAETSKRMAGVRQKGTSPELIVRKLVTVLGHRYRAANRDLAGSPDLANRRKRWAIFVHGCFWHRHSGCRLTTTPKRNAEFWLAKFERNVARDRCAIKELVDAEYRVLVIWECETRAPVELGEKLAAWFADVVSPPARARSRGGRAPRR